MKKFYVSEGKTNEEKRDALLKTFQKALSTKNLWCLFFSKDVANLLLITSIMWDKEGREESYYCIIPGNTLTFKEFYKGVYVLTGIKGGNSLPEFNWPTLKLEGEVVFVDLKR